MKTFQDLQEGVYDPNILKAFFLAGGPGSGKSYVVKRGTGGLGMKIVNSDDIFEKYIKDAGMTWKMHTKLGREQEPIEINFVQEQKKLQKDNRRIMLRVDLDLSLMVLEKTMIRLLDKHRS